MHKSENKFGGMKKHKNLNDIDSSYKHVVYNYDKVSEFVDHDDTILSSSPIQVKADNSIMSKTAHNKFGKVSKTQ